MLPKWMKPISFSATGLKCDYIGCGYSDMTIQSKDYASWINKSCPKCGANLLTKKDYKLTVRLSRIASVINILYLPIHIPRYILSKKYRELCKIALKLNLDMNGTGTVLVGKQEIIDI